MEELHSICALNLLPVRVLASVQPEVVTILTFT